MQCHLRCDCFNTQIVFKNNCNKTEKKVSGSSILCMPFVTHFIVTFIDFTCGRFHGKGQRKRSTSKSGFFWMKCER